MPINILRFEPLRRTQWGVLRGTRITPVPGDFLTTGDFIRSTSIVELVALKDAELDRSAPCLLSPVTTES